MASPEYARSESQFFRAYGANEKAPVAGGAEHLPAALLIERLNLCARRIVDLEAENAKLRAAMMDVSRTRSQEP